MHPFTLTHAPSHSLLHLYIASFVPDMCSSVCKAEIQAFNFLQASNEVDSRGPRGFFQPMLDGWHTLKDYPTLITTQMSGDRARDALTYLSVSPPMLVHCIALHAGIHTFVYASLRCTFH